MFKTFKLWLEEKESDRSVKTMLLKRLGFEPDIMDNSSIKLRDLSRERLVDQLGKMGFEDDRVELLQNWVKMNPDATLQNLLDQIGQDDVATPQDDEEMPSKPAKIVPGPDRTPQGPSPEQPFDNSVAQYNQPNF